MGSGSSSKKNKEKDKGAAEILRVSRVSATNAESLQHTEEDALKEKEEDARREEETPDLDEITKKNAILDEAKKHRHKKHKSAVKEDSDVPTAATFDNACSSLALITDKGSLEPESPKSCLSNKGSSSPTSRDAEEAKMAEFPHIPRARQTSFDDRAIEEVVEAPRADEDESRRTKKRSMSGSSQGMLAHATEADTSTQEERAYRSEGSEIVRTSSMKGIVKAPSGRSAANLDEELGLVTRKKGSSPLHAGGLSVLSGSRRPPPEEISTEPESPSRRGKRAQTEPAPSTPMSPERQARQAAIHAHKESAWGSPNEPASPSSRHDPSSPKTPGSSRSRGSSGKHHDSEDSSGSPSNRAKGRKGATLGAESLAVLHQLHDDRIKANEKDDGLCGFKVKDRVTVAGGPDAHGPCQKLGEGVVIEGGKKRGIIMVSFERSDDIFALRASSLANLTDKSRSGEDVKSRANAPKLKKVERRLDQYVFGDHILQIGDHVALAQGGNGVLLKEGENGNVLVRFGDLGIRSVPKAQLSKVKCTEETGERQEEAEMAAKVDTSNRNRFTLSLSEATGSFSEKDAWSEDRQAKSRKEEPKIDVSATIKEEPDEEEDPYMGFLPGDYCKVSDAGAGGNPMWKELGIGCVRTQGKLGTLNVQFDSGGDTFCMKASMLRKMAAPERKFRRQGEEIIAESSEGKKHSKLKRQIS